MALITAAEAKALMPGVSAASDTLLDTLISRADAIMARWCGYPPNAAGAAPTLESASYTRYSGDTGIFVDPDNARLLYLEPFPVTAITSIHDDTLEAFGSVSEVNSGQYSQRGAHGQIIRLSQTATQGFWTRGDGFIKIVFTAGYSTIRDDLKHATVETVAHLHDMKKRRGQASLSEQERVTAYRAETVPERVKELLRPYRLPSALV